MVVALSLFLSYQYIFFFHRISLISFFDNFRRSWEIFFLGLCNVLGILQGFLINSIKGVV